MRNTLAIIVAFVASTAHAFDPVETYTKRTVGGFTVFVNPAVLAHEKEANAGLQELEAQIAKINAVVPEKPLAALRKVSIWMEWESKPKGAAEFHVSPDWLKSHGYNPAKLKAVEINNARNFVKWSRQTQPWMVLHELAHAYHFTVLGDKHPGLVTAYKQAMDRKLYDTVKHVSGRTEKAYAATNPAEYFAELSEAYFGKNDFAPFTRSELEKHDPVGFKLMQDVWGTR